jgi:glycosyltransferase involved in cell wall biosynthesis
MSRPRVLVVGDAVVPTGYARVLRCVLERLHTLYEFHHLGVNHRGDPHGHPWPIYPAGLGGDHQGVARLGPLVERLQPQVVWLSADLPVLAQHAQVLGACRHRPASIAYVPVDSGPVVPATLAPLLHHVDHLATFTHHAAAELQSAAERARRYDPKLPVPAVTVIGHGVDTAAFHPLPGGRRAARARLFPHRPDLHDGFIVLNANRNQPRKRIDLTMEAFARFAQGKPPGVRLYLHMAREDLGWDVKLLGERLGILDRLLLTQDGDRLPDIGDDQLNLIYNACDVGVNTAHSEAWGLVSFEHAATGAAQVVPAHGALPELWDGAAELVPPRWSLTVERLLHTAHFVAPEDVADALERLYGDAALRQRLADAALARVREPWLSWDAVAGQWGELLQQALD